MNVPFNRVEATPHMVNAVTRSLSSGHWSGDGAFTAQVVKRLSQWMPSSLPLLTTSASQALEMAVVLSDIQAGDEVILPSFTYASCANAVLNAGGRPVFAAVSEETLCLEPESVERLLSPRVKAIMPVHYGGVAAEMDRLTALCRERGLSLIEDAAQAIGASWKGQALGTLGDFGAISFHDTKNVTSGEGGLLLVNASRQDLWERAQILHQKGTDRLKFLSGRRDRYEWVGQGVSASPSELLMALLLPQLETLETINERRREIVGRYEAVLMALECSGDLLLSHTKVWPEGNGHLFFLRFKSAGKATDFKAFMKARGVDVRTHYHPLHAAPQGRGFRYDPALDSVRDRDLMKCVVRLPMSHHLNDAEIDYVCEVLKDALIHCHTRL